MSIRIHELAKKIGMENKALLALLKERNFDVKSVSSTVDNINAEALVEEFAATAPAEGTAAAGDATADQPDESAATSAEPLPPQGFVTRLPAGVMVKSAEDVVRERAEKAAAAEAAAAEARAAANPPPAPASAPAVSTPPPPPAPAPVPAQARVSAPPPPPAARAASAPPPPPAPVSRPSSLPPLSVPPRPATAGAPPPTPSFSTSTTPPIPPVPPSQTATITNEGDIPIIHLKPPIIVRDFATALGMKPFKLISELMEMGIFASMNQTIEDAVATRVAEKHGFLLEIKHREIPVPVTPKDKEAEKKRRAKEAQERELANLAPRPPVVCILGHVDHGKTSLLDAIRKADVAKGEAGGITQHIGAYQIEHAGKKITFLDTPGHAAFQKMRARGAAVTDIAVLVVAADDGFMPQTDEALKHAQDAGVSLMVAVNKMDVKGANLERVKQMMQERNIAPEDWGGETITVPVSAVKGTGIPDLLDMILLQAEVLELKANPKAEASGVIIESQIDIGRGPLATVIVQRGTLKVGDSLVCGPVWAKVRALFDDQGNSIKQALPSTPVRVIGWNGAPDSGSAFRTVKNAREAENLAEEEQHRIRQTAATAASAPKDVSLDNLFQNIAATQEKVLKLIIKTDVFGSTEAVRNVLEGIKTNKVSLEIVADEVGLISKTDVLMASAAGAVIIGFNTKLENGVTPLAKHHGVRIETYGIIYELADKVRDMMADLLEPDLKEVKLGAAEIRATFPLAKGFVAGCLVTEGKITRNAAARVRRKKDVVYEGKVAMLKRFKDDANEVRAGLECGIKLDDFSGYAIGDVIEVYEVQKVRASL
ncbi:translation initiation factor IF-2 [Opitutaceae bacterium TAV5]|nr:translation initiation factor IF-2 [Opitutaceae bacterium TAV5]